MLSMTGYGYAEEIYEEFQITVEMRSLNNRFLDINLRTPYLLNSYDVKIRNIIKDYVKRGKIDLMINIDETSHDVEIIPDMDTVDKYYMAFDKILKHVKTIDNNFRDNIRLFNLLNAEGVINVREKKDAEKIWDKVESMLITALEQLVESRTKEGEGIKEDLSSINEYLKEKLHLIKGYSDESMKNYEDKLKTKMKELLQDANIEEDKILQEVAAMSTKTDINEEMNRLESHIKLFKDTIQEDDSVGRKLDFISQEMHREINTIGAKSNHIEISNVIINMKTELEKIKEQIRNVE